jgi:photosystem II stability/assembly factor-like uncharacterized protein
MKKFRASLILAIILFSSVIYSQHGWFRLTSGVSAELNGVTTLQNSAWAVGNGGIILRTTNRGANWFTQVSGTAANLNDVIFKRDTVGFIAGAGGVILTSTNSGANWVQRITGSSANLNALYWLADTVNVLAIGDGGVILRSHNLGLNWTLITSPVNVNLNDVIANYDMEFVIAGDGGKILTSYDEGFTWYQRPSGTAADLNTVAMPSFYVSYSRIFAAGDNGTLIRSTNHGMNWSPLTSGTTSNLLSMQGLTIMGDTMFYLIAVGSGGTMIESVNGDVWVNRSLNISDNLNSIFLSDLNFGFISGSGGSIFKSVGNYVYIDSRTIDANTISANFNNDGGFNMWSDTTLRAGFEWPKGSGKFARFASGLWIGAVVSGNVRVTTAHYYDCEYYPGYLNSGGTATGRNDSNYRIYRMTHNTPTPDRTNWPNALLGNSDQGAPVYFDSLSSSWKALDFGSQTMFYSYTDGYPEAHTNYSGGMSLPLKADVKQLNFSLNVGGPLGNTVFTQYTIINRSNTVWDDAIFTIWSDDDLGDGYDDLVGCDSALSMGYTYNGSNYDAVYGSAPPAVGFVLLKGAHKFTGNNNDTVRYCRNKSQVVTPRYRDQGMSAFQYSVNGHPYNHDPDSTQQSYWLMQGLLIDGTTMYNYAGGGYVTTLAFSGDPVTSQGWVAEFFDDYRMFISTGPIDMNPGDTQIIVTAQVIAKGNDNLNSITALRSYVNEVKTFYNSCYTSTPIGITQQPEVVLSYSLHQNYPNPFNPVTTIKYDIPISGLVTVKVYDILGREVFTKSEFKTAGSHGVVFDGTNLASGLYFYSIEAGQFKETKKMVLIK